MTGSNTLVDGERRVQAPDLLRLVAVIGVILFHYGFRGPTAQNVVQVALPELSPFARYGFLGVPVFFIISGFFIAYSAEGRSAPGFAIARVARIYPAFVFCMTLTFLSMLAFGSGHFETSFTQWIANLFAAAPALHQPYMDSAYWSLFEEITFYAWVTILMAAGLFQRSIDIIVLVWLFISLANELTIDAAAIEKVFLADHSGFFATGLLIYELYRGRRDALFQCLLALSVATAVFQAVHNLGGLRSLTGAAFDGWIVAAICLVDIIVIIWATRIQRVPLPAGTVIAIGGLTYPLYLLHQQIGYVEFNWIGAGTRPTVLFAVILSAIALLSWVTWRYVEQPGRRLTKELLTTLAARIGWAAKPNLVQSQNIDAV
jgi:peptidoglycan/LPS O-acetylase OafA/YrhL